MSAVTKTQNIVVAGASVAGVSAVDALRTSGFDGTITLLSDELEAPYDRPPLSKAYLDGAKESELVRLRDAGHFQAQKVDFRPGHGAAGLDIDRRFVITTDGDPLPWDHLIVATGSSPDTLFTDEGIPVPSLRTCHDAERLRRAARNHRRVTLIGAGFISLEIAASLRMQGADVTVVGGGVLPLRASVGPEVATTIRDLHLAHGVRLLMGAQVQGISGREGAFRLHLSDGTVHETAYVLAGTGTRPNTGWLDGSGVTLDPVTGGVVCMASGQSSVPGVWAAGDVALYDHPVLGPRTHVGHWTNASQQARHVAKNIVEDTGESYTTLPYFWTDQYDRKLQCYGRRRDGDVTVVAEGSLESGTYLVLFGQPKTNRFHAVLSNGLDRSLRPYLKLLRAGADWSTVLGQRST